MKKRVPSVLINTTPSSNQRVLCLVDLPGDLGDERVGVRQTRHDDLNQAHELGVDDEQVERASVEPGLEDVDGRLQVVAADGTAPDLWGTQIQ